MKIYIDIEYKCHVSDDGTRREVEIDFFAGKCAEFIEGYKYDDSNGYVSIYPWKPYAELEAAQREYELDNAVKKVSELETIIDVMLTGGVTNDV